MKTYHLHINGIVQGVGFRPLAFRLAREQQLRGRIENGSDGVHLYFNADAAAAQNFFNTLISQLPAASMLTSAGIQPAPPEEFTDLRITREAPGQRSKAALPSPDLALCPQCRQELHDPQNRRYRYPFITCTHCGPRYSILGQLPYEREHSAMNRFTPCPHCAVEYANPDDRRFFSQTNSCPQCGIHFSVSQHNSGARPAENETTLQLISEQLSAGKILAVKGIGGYLLLCDATAPAVIRTLRERKHRPSKPLAILYRDEEAVLRDFHLTTGEATLLNSAEAPIVLLRPRKQTVQPLALQEIAPGLHRIGVMLAYNPLLDLIASDFGKPLVATSGNIAGSPILYEQEQAEQHLPAIADYLIHHNRPILIPVDDSVSQLTPIHQTPILLRRARGYAPTLTGYRPVSSGVILATGALLKSSFALAINGNVFVSQFLGNTERYETRQAYQKTLEHWLRLYDARPDVIATDLHPDYFSHELAANLASRYETPLATVQHHEAHAAAILAEHQLINRPEPALCFVWDGTGLGHNGHILGGETFRYEDHGFRRIHQFDFIPGIAGDRLAAEPRIAALAATQEIAGAESLLRPRFSNLEWKIYQALAAAADHSVSSAGRLFDAVAALLQQGDRQQYEGEAALRLQVLAEKYLRRHGHFPNESYLGPGETSTRRLLENLVDDIVCNRPDDYIAAKFHSSLVHLIGNLAATMQVHTLCFSGGVFQNSLLVDCIQSRYQQQYQLCFHRHLPPNDENISFGQLVYVDQELTSFDNRGEGVFNQPNPGMMITG